MFEYAIRAICGLKTNLEILLEMIENQEQILSNDSGQSFMVGKWKYSPSKHFSYFKVLFSTNYEDCIVKSSIDNDTLFIFEDPEEVELIRRYIEYKRSSVNK